MVGLRERYLLTKLEEDWDSYGAGPIGEKAMKALDEIEVFPCSNGGVELRIGPLEIDISEDGLVTGFCADIPPKAQDI